MGNEWPLTKLGDFVDIKTGNPFKSKDYSENEGIRLLRGDNIVQGQFRWANVKYWPENLLGDKENNYFLINGDVILAMDRPWIEAGLKTAQINDTDLPCLLVQRTACLRTKIPDDQDYLRYLISSYWFVQYVKLVQTGTAVPHISPKQIKDFEFKKPPQKDRILIGKMMKSLDSKIHLNLQTNQTLEQMAQTLFKSWFVDFDPVFDNALLKAGIPTWASDSNEDDQQLLASFPEALRPKAKLRLNALRSKQKQGIPTQELGNEGFPSEFEFNEQLGWIPKGWASAQLGDLTTELRRGISPKYIEEGGVQVINQKCIRNHEVNFSLCRRNNPELRNITGRQLIVGDLLINSTGVGTLGRMAQVKYLEEETVIDSHLTIVRVKRDLYPAYSFAQMMLSMESHIEAIGEGSTGQTELSRKIVSELWVLVPQEQALIDLDNQLKAYSDKMVLNTRKNIKLTKLRDTLLPKLISGELQIPIAEQLVKEMA